MTEPAQYLTTSQASRLMGVSVSTVREYCRDGTLPGSVQVGGKGPWKIPVESVNTWGNARNISLAPLEKKYFPPSAWLRFRNNPYIFYPTMVFAIIAAILALMASVITITGNWDDTVLFAKENGIISTFPKAREGEILIIVSEFDYSEGLINTKAHNEIISAIKNSAQKLKDTSIRVELFPVKLDSDDIQKVQKIGERYKASMMIWGEDTGAHIVVNFLNIKNPDYVASEIQISEMEKTQLVDPKAYARYVTGDLPGQLSYFSMLAIGQTYYWANENSLSIAAFETALSSLENDQSILEGQAGANYYLGNLYLFINIDRSIEYFTKAIELDPHNAAYAYNNRGNAWGEKGNLDQAIADFTKAIELDPQDSCACALNNRGNAWVAKGELDQAIADFSKAIDLNSHYASSYFNRGIAWREKGELSKAIADFDEAIQLDPYEARFYNGRGAIRRDKGDLASAIADLNKAIEIDPQFSTPYYQYLRQK
jgi:excisionase family DNA binding protein